MLRSRKQREKNHTLTARFHTDLPTAFISPFCAQFTLCMSLPGHRGLILKMTPLKGSGNGTKSFWAKLNNIYINLFNSAPSLSRGPASIFNQREPYIV